MRISDWSSDVCSSDLSDLLAAKDKLFVIQVLFVVVKDLGAILLLIGGAFETFRYLGAVFVVLEPWGEICKVAGCFGHGGFPGIVERPRHAPSGTLDKHQRAVLGRERLEQPIHDSFGFTTGPEPHTGKVPRLVCFP